MLVPSDLEEKSRLFRIENGNTYYLYQGDGYFRFWTEINGKVIQSIPYFDWMINSEEDIDDLFDSECGVYTSELGSYNAKSFADLAEFLAGR